jgi:hypothetical protein
MMMNLSFFTSPRLRGEVDARGAAGEGLFPHSGLVENPPHPAGRAAA